MNNISVLIDLVRQYALFKNTIIIIIVGFAIGIIFVLLLGKWSKLANIKLEAKYHPLFKDLINEHIHSNQNLYTTNLHYIDLPLNKFKEHDLSRREVRSILVDIILDLRSELHGERKRLLRKLYKDLDLELYAILDLDALKGNSLVLVINELVAMEIVVEEPIMRKFLACKDPHIKNAAERYVREIAVIIKERESKEYFSNLKTERLEVE